ncbi:MAG: mechanosensitive ion channel family protein, partial [Pseudomonadota bacterium]|nr:mechanosensitive ion channel family protein [Pseudomonadota bacterium]
MDEERSTTLDQTAEAAADTAPAAAQELAQDVALGLASDFERFLTGLLRPWNAYQVAIALGLVLATYLLTRVLGPRLHDWMRTLTGWPTWRMRILVILHKRLNLILFAALIWPTVWIMREVTWPSRSYMLAIIAQLALAWLVIAFLTRLIGNKFIRSVVRYTGWIWVTLSILNLTVEAQALLQSAAVDFGDLQLSLWTVVQGIAVVGVLIAAARFLARVTTDRIRRNAEISPSMQVLLVKVLQLALYSAALFVGLKAVGVDLTGLAFLSGAIGVGLGFGLQKVVSNLVSGVI